jgi:hypothetical protein
MCNSPPTACNPSALGNRDICLSKKNKMTLAQQFPDVSMLIREKKKLSLKYNEAELFKDIHYNPISVEQKFYDKEFRNWHYKVLIYLACLFTGLYYLILNARVILSWLTF